MTINAIRNSGEIFLVGAYCCSKGINPVTGIAAYALLKVSSNVVPENSLVGRALTIVQGALLVSFFLHTESAKIKGDPSLIRENGANPIDDNDNIPDYSTF